MSTHSIAFIGGGNMSNSLVGGLTAQGTSADTIWVTDTIEDKLRDLRERYRVNTTKDNVEAVGRADTVVLAVKPQNMAEVTRGLGAATAEGRSERLFISIAAGIPIDNLQRWLGYDAAIVRTMPNTPALVGEGATALYANPRVTSEQRSRADAVLNAVGLTHWVEDEGLLDAVTAVSGSGPAYFFLLMEMIEETGVALGLERDASRALTLQTALGAAQMVRQGSEAPAILRERVTSPGGTTAQALAALEEGGVRALFARAITAARDRSVALGRDLGDE